MEMLSAQETQQRHTRGCYWGWLCWHLFTFQALKKASVQISHDAVYANGVVVVGPLGIPLEAWGPSCWTKANLTDM